MKTPDGRLRTRTYLLLVLLISAGLAACGILAGSTMVELAMNLFGTDAAGVLGSGSTPWLLISLGLGLVGFGMRYRKKNFPRHVGAGDGQRPHRILPGFPGRDDLRGRDRVAGRGVIPFRVHATLHPRLGDGDKERTSKEEESAMKTPERTFRNVRYLLLTLTISAALAACGGGGGGSTGSTSPGVAGPATVDISIAAADVTGSEAPAVAVSGSDTVPSTDPGYLWPEQVTQPDPRIAHVYMEVVKVSLMPAGETFDGGDMNGEMQNGNSPDPAAPPDKPHFITLVPDHPIPIDLLTLKNGKKVRPVPQQVRPGSWRAPTTRSACITRT